MITRKFRRVREKDKDDNSDEWDYYTVYDLWYKGDILVKAKEYKIDFRSYSPNGLQFYIEHIKDAMNHPIVLREDLIIKEIF